MITHLEGMQNMPELVYRTLYEQIKLLSSEFLENDSEHEANLGTDAQGGDGFRTPN